VSEEQNEKASAGKSNDKSTVSRILSNGALVELVYDPKAHATALATCHEGQWTIERHIQTPEGEQLVPYSPDNNLIKNEAVLLPSEPMEYGDEKQLLSDIRKFLHKYVDLSPAFESISSYYVLLTWLHDEFNELPYLRLRGDFGTGKTRTLLTLGSLCYKAFFASGASTVSPIFHTLDAFRGTLIFDEADFRFSDERAEIVKILNNGNVRGIPLLRTIMNRQREFNPQAFQVFGPKIVATRGHYEDKGLESRFITEEMGGRPLRTDIPINLPPAFKDEARLLRNKLLLYRFHRRFQTKLNESLVDPAIEPRLNQILLPLLSIVRDPNVRDELRTLARETQTALVAERGQLVEAHILEVLAGLMEIPDRIVVTVGDVAGAVTQQYGTEYERPITNRWVGGILRKRLNVRTYKSHGVYVVPMSERAKIRLLCTRYGIDAQEETIELGDVGTSGTLEQRPSPA
jgi:hypothetical protein